MMSKFKDKFQLTPEQSLFLAKKEMGLKCSIRHENKL